MKSLDEIIRQLAERVLAQERGTWKGGLRQKWAPWFEDLTYGVECKAGWQTLVEQTLGEIARAVGGPQARPELRITRLREEMGSLVLQFTGLSGEREQAVQRILDEAMKKSMREAEGDE